jgi:hypothetical protein
MIRRARPLFATWLLCSSVVAWAQTAALRTVQVLVALADNEHQGIVPVPAKLGNGEDAEHNLYWGSAYGIKTFFSRSADWHSVGCCPKPQPAILERCIFKYHTANLYSIADAYRGIEIEQALLDFFDSAAGIGEQTLTVPDGRGGLKLPIRGGANLVAYIGHDGLMDFPLRRLASEPRWPSRRRFTGVCQQAILRPGSACRWGLSAAVDDRPDGSRGIHTQNYVGWLDCG